MERDNQKKEIKLDFTVVYHKDKKEVFNFQDLKNSNKGNNIIQQN